ncbi:aldehyde dehydrogenase (NADP(+)) [Natronoglycomyces albus]|uniref:Aldehyde dehydrogenase (NADP(+)) n=1 Tax=Natronoglycomyces albus TaxID=2811108 RepID=A0A895XP41_9ACTN|nr:aldehyde dehydrogenase (NADP(+)) [Natronoglycomyces albus]QSB07124.1 aldehyde dehydrogenase (NADP(+)) [Natronoglycomyces albus]
MTEKTSHAETNPKVDAATQSFDALARLTPARRAELLDAIAAALDERADELVPVAMTETHLPEARLRGELKRTTFQLRLFGEVLRDGGYLDARIDHADPDWPMGAPRPDLRRVHQPLGPVAVFAASNFPFAFSVAGGDTASALAAGNPVIVKAHPGHPRLSELTARTVIAALVDFGLPAGVFDLVYGTEAGRQLVQHPGIRAAGFTGSIQGGRALFDLAAARPEPIPFYGELGSNNPVFVTETAANARAGEIAQGFIDSFTLGAGQFCTKPGILAVPAGSQIVARLREAELPEVHPMLNERIESGFRQARADLTGHVAVKPLGEREDVALFQTTAEAVLADPQTLQSECFGPAALVVEYTSQSQLLELAESFDGQLTATIHAEHGCDIGDLVQVLARTAGRVLYNGWPTGVSVTHAQQHGGPYPATTAAGTTSVGTAAIGRFLRPVAYQGFPDSALPDALKESNPLGLPRMVDGVRV